MTFEVELRGRTRTVSIERAAAGKYRVILDGDPHDVDAARVGIHGLSMLVDGEHGVSREIQVTPRGDDGRGAQSGEFLVTIEGRTVPVTVDARRTRRASRDSTSGGPGEQAVVAPMPGRVVRVLVSAGEAVEHRQGVLVVEAMKMENELTSPKKGRVKSISVTPGTSVEAGRVMLVVE
jgi:biotin carboxyl carrier protein